MNWRSGRKLSAKVLQHSLNKTMYPGVLGLLGTAVAFIVIYPFLNILLKSLGVAGAPGSAGISGFSSAV